MVPAGSCPPRTLNRTTGPVQPQPRTPNGTTVRFGKVRVRTKVRNQTAATLITTTSPFNHHQSSSLLARLTAHSPSSGHTPPTLSPLFGPLLFGLGPAALPFHITYLEYLRAINAMEHVLLAFVRWQDAPSNELSGSFGRPGNTASLGIPTGLKEWIRGYPAMLPEPGTRSRKHESLQPLRGARTVRIVCVRGNIRMYTHDPVKTATTLPVGLPDHRVGSLTHQIHLHNLGTGNK